ncbi:MAG TPA: hypothetical protein VE258_15150 [Ktedonobacterales bacterium]|nr:hypothetical protein [Ktedonobacterales bacterium]
MAEQPRGGLAWLWGLLCGGLAAAVILLDRFAPIRPARRIVAVGAIPLLPFVLGLLFFFLAGLIAARRSYRLESGLAAGLIAGASAGLMNVTLVLVEVVAAGTRTRAAGIQRSEVVRLLQVTVLAHGLGALLILAILSLGMGALGGLAGRGRPPAAQPWAPYAPMPPPPPPMPPRYPPQPPATSYGGALYPSSSPYTPSDDPTVLTSPPPQP